MAPDREDVTGYLVDLACLRRYAHDEMLTRARVHSRACALMPHCVESGYGLVTEQGRVIPLDVAATPLVYDAVRQSAQERGIRARVSRTRSDQEMETESLVVV